MLSKGQKLLGFSAGLYVMFSEISPIFRILFREHKIERSAEDSLDEAKYYIDTL